MKFCKDCPATDRTEIPKGMRSRCIACERAAQKVKHRDKVMKKWQAVEGGGFKIDPKKFKKVAIAMDPAGGSSTSVIVLYDPKAKNGMRILDEKEKKQFYITRKKTHADFPQSVKSAWDRFTVLFEDTAEHSRWWKCLACEKMHKNCFHHLFGRGGGSNEIRKLHSSILNSFPCNNEECHISNGETVHTTTPGSMEVSVVFLLVKLAVEKGLYFWTAKDREFYAHHHETYERLGLFF